jgi:hypothetical protein
MKDSRDQKSIDAYWEYLEKNSRVVSAWPAWLKGERSSASQTQDEHADDEKPKDLTKEELAS